MKKLLILTAAAVLLGNVSLAMAGTCNGHPMSAGSLCFSLSKNDHYKHVDNLGLRVRTTDSNLVMGDESSPARMGTYPITEVCLIRDGPCIETFTASFIAACGNTFNPGKYYYIKNTSTQTKISISIACSNEPEPG